MEETRWIRAGMTAKIPLWGFSNGIQVGLWPADVEGKGDGGPRGLFRVGYPIKEEGRAPGLVNFVAVEPIVDGRRGFSELEPSDQDKKPGKRFWSGMADKQSEELDPGRLEKNDTVETLSVTISIEPFQNGAKPVVELTFHSDRPGEVGFTVQAAPDSAPMESCVLTATMGNYMRLRRLHLRDHIVQPTDLWRDFKGSGFTPDAFFPLHLLPVTPSGDLLVCATTDEENPHAVPADPAAPWWQYRGSFPLTQYWRKPKGTWKEDLRLRVNGRRVYWAGEVPIPGGLAYENFDLVAPFTGRQTSVFGLSRSTPAERLHAAEVSGEM
jgi:hypothetical protein